MGIRLTHGNVSSSSHQSTANDTPYTPKGNGLASSQPVAGDTN